MRIWVGGVFFVDDWFVWVDGSLLYDWVIVNFFVLISRVFGCWI